MIDASLDVFCTINEHGDFGICSASAENLWGYLPKGTNWANHISIWFWKKDVPKTQCKQLLLFFLSGT